METSEPLPRWGVDAPELAELAHLTGPFLSLYLITEGDVENAVQRSEVRWKHARSDLARRGAPEAVLKEIDDFVPDAHLAGETLAVIADSRQIRHIEHGPGVAPVDLAWWEAAPRLLPILHWQQTQLPHLIVLTDRTGADLYSLSRGAPELIGEVEGERDFPMHKTKTGGWSQRRIQQRVENTWAENARDVADVVTRAVRDIDARVVVVAGDVRAVQLLRESLPETVDELVRVIDKEPPRHRPEDPLPQDVTSLVHEHVRAETAALLDRFAEERGQHDKAAEGVDRTAEALSMAQVAVLLVAEDGDEDRALWFGTDPIPVSAEPNLLEELGVSEPVRDEARDVLVRAALGTGAGVRVLDPDLEPPREGVGALLRWPAG
jgi:release factor family 2